MSNAVALMPMQSIDEIRINPIDDDEVCLKFIRKEFQEFDLGLYATKWFDYRHMTPLQATRLYIEKFSEAYKTAFRREIDHERGQFVRGLDLDQMLTGLGQGATKHKANFIGCWRGRQVADALGMPYEIYLDLAISYRLRRWNRTTLPRPCHLYHEYDVEKIQLRWEEMQAAQIYTSSHPAYLVQNYQNIPHQNDYHEWLFKQAAMRSNAPFYLAAFVENDQLFMNKIEARFGADAIEQVESYLH